MFLNCPSLHQSSQQYRNVSGTPGETPRNPTTPPPAATGHDSRGGSNIHRPAIARAGRVHAGLRRRGRHGTLVRPLHPMIFQTVLSTGLCQNLQSRDFVKIERECARERERARESDLQSRVPGEYTLVFSAAVGTGLSCDPYTPNLKP